MKRLVWSAVVIASLLIMNDRTASAEEPSTAGIEHAGLKTLVQGDLVYMGNVPKSCRFKGKDLWGKVQVVKSFPDFKVKVVSSFPDLKVKRVTSFPDKCGLWQYVTSFPGFKVQFVTSFPDFTIKYVTSFPGVD
jgi:hypothetical protein